MFFYYDEKDGTFYPIGEDNSMPIGREEYQARVPYYQIVSEKNGFVGSSTRSNIVQGSITKLFPYTGSTHVFYNMHPSQTVLLNKSIDSLVARHPYNHGFFVRFKATSGGVESIFQTSSYDDSYLLCLEIDSILTNLNTNYEDAVITTLTLVVRI